MEQGFKWGKGGGRAGGGREMAHVLPAPYPAPGKPGQASSSCLPPLLQGLSDGGMDKGPESHTLEGEIEPAGKKGSALH